MHNENTIITRSGELILIILLRQSFRTHMPEVSAVSAREISFETIWTKVRWFNSESICICIILAGAGGTDLFWKKVKNWWLVLGVILGIWCRKGAFFLPAAVVLIPVFFLWHLRMMGAGDGKVMALIAGFLGFYRGICAIWTGLCIGAVWSIYRFWYDKSFRARLSHFFVYFMRMINNGTMEPYDNWSENKGGNRHRIPLVFCLAIGVYLYLLAEQFCRGF